MTNFFVGFDDTSKTFPISKPQITHTFNLTIISLLAQIGSGWFFNAGKFYSPATIFINYFVKPA